MTILAIVTADKEVCIYRKRYFVFGTGIESQDMVREQIESSTPEICLALPFITTNKQR